MSDNKTENQNVIRNLLFVVVGMFGFGFALVPLYDVFCDLTGLNGKTNGKQYTASDPVRVDTSRTIRVEFVANLNAGMPWEFKPLTYQMEVHPGEVNRVEFLAKNLTNKDITGHAVPSVSPGLAASYFHKTECFCFTEQVLKSGEEKNMPVVFMIDPSIDEDIHELTLSYTFFVKPGSEDAEPGSQYQAALLSRPLLQL